MALPTQAIGWAIKDNGFLLVKTVGPNKRSACVNFIFANRRLTVLDSATNEQIEQLWQAHKGKAEAVRVSIEELPKLKRRRAS